MAKQRRSKIVFWVILTVLIVGTLGYGGWRIMQLRKTAAILGSTLGAKTEELNQFKSELATNPTGTIQRIQAESTQSVIDEIGKLYTLPSNEQPTVATVQDKSKLEGQDFFKDAQNGDQLVVYEKSGLAILYRPSENKLIKVGPIDVKNDQAATEQPTTQEP
ncbi:MAG: DUF515 domain-containing protein [bacterium]|nr:DUF515 domain-containing protein [bacterium]